MTTLALLALGTLVIYIIVCVIWPFGPCRRCSGTGKRRSPTRRYWRPCGHCDGTGRRVRLGRVLFEMTREEG